MAKLDFDKFALQVCDAMRLGRKTNPGIAKARKDFGPAFINRILKKKSFSNTAFGPAEQKKLQKLMDVKYGPLVYPSSRGKLKVKTEVGETLSLSYVNTDERAKAIAMAIRNEAWRRGCHVNVKSGNDADSKLYFNTVPEDTLTEMPPLALSNVKNIDATISIGDKQDREWSKGLEKKLLLGAPSGQVLFDQMDRRRIRWCGIGFPVKMNKKKDYLVSPAKYEKIYIDSITETYTGSIQALCRYYRKALEGADNIRLTADDGTNLSFSIKGRPILVADGVIDDEDMERGDVGLNIPDGETFLAPLEHSANGKIYFDFCNIPGQGFAKGGLWIHFKNGKVVRYEGSKTDRARFKRFLDANTGEKDRIAELGIGTNPAARFIGTIIVDEKIYGTIHIAIGNNTGAYHGKNRASSHFDMIKQMKGKNGNMYVDGKLVMKNGEPAGKV